MYCQALREHRSIHMENLSKLKRRKVDFIKETLVRIFIWICNSKVYCFRLMMRRLEARRRVADVGLVVIKFQKHNKVEKIIKRNRRKNHLHYWVLARCRQQTLQGIQQA